MMICVQVPATSANLGPGFDCLGVALKLYNTVEMKQIGNGLIIEVSGDGLESIPRDKSNLVYQAAKKVFKKINYQVTGLKIRLTNRIPVCRGLGSSAAAIVGGMVGANALAGNPLKMKDLLQLATEMEGHPDNVAPALLGGMVVSAMDGAEVHCLNVPIPNTLKMVVAIPDFKLSTQKARDVLPEKVSISDAVFNISRTALFVTALFCNDMEKLGLAMEDRLHQPYRSVLVPGMKKVLAAAKLAGARGVVLSGAGPTIIAFADNNQELVATVMKKTFRENEILAKVMVLEPSSSGSTALELI